MNQLNADSIRDRSGVNLNLQVRDADVSRIINSAAQHAEIMKNKVAGMSATRARKEAAKAKGTDAMASIVRAMLSRGANKAQALHAAIGLA